MKRFLLFIVLTAIFVFSGENKLNKKIESRINELLSKMTIEEKVGQMTQITLEVVQKERKSNFVSSEVDMQKLREAILKYKVGSILNTGGAANTLKAWHKIITNIQDVAVKESRLGIPVIYGIDAIHGANYTIGATIFPQSVSLAATRNRDLVKKVAEITSLETIASGIPWNFNPVLGLGKEPLWPRHWETFGEDVYLTTELGLVYMQGHESGDISRNDRAVACIKHFLGYSVPKNGRDRTPADIPERILREHFLVPFAEAVKNGAMTVMINSGSINGIPAHADKFVLTTLLKEELGFNGFTVSDWEDIKKLHTRHRVAATPKEAVKLAVLAGMDMSMVPDDYSFFTYLAELVKDGEVPVERIDDAVRRILRVKMMLGLFENSYPDKSLLNKFATEQSTKTNYQAAAESITLLKNDGLLPLDKSKKYLVTGPTSDLMKVMNGGWTLTWQGEDESLYPKEKHTLKEALINKLGNNILFSQGADLGKEVNLDETLEMVKNVDAIILCLGEKTYCEGKGSINDLNLAEHQIKFAEKITSLGKPVVLVLFEGRPRLITKITDKVNAIVQGYLPGFEGGLAMTDVLLGEINPSGKLPYSYPKYPNGFTTYDYSPLEADNPENHEHLFPFGHGLSYTTFEYSNLQISNVKPLMNEKIEISVEVKNSGQKDGKETVELYICDLYASVMRPVRQLKGFEKVNLKVGETKRVKFEIDKNSLAFVGIDNKWITEPGKFEVYIKDLKTSFELREK